MCDGYSSLCNVTRTLLSKSEVVSGPQRLTVLRKKELRKREEEGIAERKENGVTEGQKEGRFIVTAVRT
jgi:hypothetical protein